MRRRTRLLLASSHPGPTLVVTALATLLGIAVGLGGWRLAGLALAVVLGQLSIGLSNDAIDARRDREAGRTDKPVAAGEVSARVVGGAAVLTLLGAIGISFALGTGMGVAHTVAIAGGWAYNLGLKGTAVSVVPFAVSFGLLPSFATLSSQSPVPAAGWASMTGALLGIAAHMSNALPDFDDDARTGVRGLPHRLGARASALVAYAALAVGAVVVLLGTGRADGAGGPGALAVVGLVFTLALALAGGAMAMRQSSTRLHFRLIMAGGLLIAVQLVAGGTSLAG